MTMNGYRPEDPHETARWEAEKHRDKVTAVIRAAVSGHVHNYRAEIEVTRDVLAALDAAGFVVVDADTGTIDGE